VYSNRYAVYILWPESVPEGFLLQCTCQLQELGWRIWRWLFHYSSVCISVICEIVTGEWRRLHNEELNDLYSSPSIVRVIKSRRMRWDGHVARVGEERGA